MIAEIIVSSRMSESVRAHLLVLVKRTFNMDEEHSLRVLRSILDCAQSKKLVRLLCESVARVK